MVHTPSYPYVQCLGTAGGPTIWLEENPSHGQISSCRCGIATAIVISPQCWYLVDAGHGSYMQARRAGLAIEHLRGVFITHLHSDHIIDLNNFVLFGLFSRPDGQMPKVPIFGPADRGELPEVSTNADPQHPPQALYPANPTPGIVDTFDSLMAAAATDINDRVLDALRPSPLDLWAPEDIKLPADCGFNPNHCPTPAMQPFEVHADEHVRVSATLVEHPPIAPAFAFRFDIAGGLSVTISGDTKPCENLVRLAQNTDLLLHEAIDFQWVAARYPGDDERSQAGREHHHKSHSSPRGAAEVAEKAVAKKLALHHLVPSSSPREVWLEAADYCSCTVLIPEDLERIELAGDQPCTH